MLPRHLKAQEKKTVTEVTRKIQRYNMVKLVESLNEVSNE